MIRPVVWIETVDRPREKREAPALPNRGAVVSVEKVADQMYRLVDHGRPLELGLFNTPANAAEFCKQRGWRPETASLITAPKRQPAVNSRKESSKALDFQFGQE